MSDERIDFSPLDPRKDAAHFERLVGNITWRARMELARRAALQRVSPVEAVAFWYRPAMAAAAVIAIVSATLLATMGGNTADVPTGSYMSSAEVPVALSSWYEEGNSPTATELLVASEENGNGNLR
jgi:hypothetical protein